MQHPVLLALTISFVTLAAVASAQDRDPPIVLVKVKPEKGVFKDSTWNKPIVIKSAEEAAKHFRKDELAALTKQVDFKKQFVLVFAWIGNSGDKLEYTVAESFPEQINFTWQQGELRDVRYHTRVYALRSNVIWSLAKPGVKVKDPDAPDKPAVRPIPFNAKDPTVIFTIGGLGKLIALTDAQAVEKLVGKASAKPLIDAVAST